MRFCALKARFFSRKKRVPETKSETPSAKGRLFAAKGHRFDEKNRLFIAKTFLFQAKGCRASSKKRRHREQTSLFTLKKRSGAKILPTRVDFWLSDGKSRIEPGLSSRGGRKQRHTPPRHLAADGPS